MKTTIFILANLLLFCSCVNTKKTGLVRLKKGQILYHVKETPKSGESSITPEFGVYRDTLKKSILAKILITNPELNEVSLFKKDSVHLTKPIFVNVNNSIRTNKHFTVFKDEEKYKITNFETYTGAKFKYIEAKPIMQAISIPLKIRFAQGDGVPYAAEGGNINLGIAYGWKFSYKKMLNIYDLNKSYLSKKTKDFSFTPAIFAGPTAVKLSSTLSKAGIQYGVLGVLGFDSVSLGIAGGFEYAFDKNTSWPYNGKFWTGAVLTIDFIK